MKDQINLKSTTSSTILLLIAISILHPQYNYTISNVSPDYLEYLCVAYVHTPIEYKLYLCLWSVGIWITQLDAKLHQNYTPSNGSCRVNYFQGHNYPNISHITHANESFMWKVHSGCVCRIQKYETTEWSKWILVDQNF